jgi:phosphoribosylformylglycinamidine cyclo-ligase
MDYKSAGVDIEKADHLIENVRSFAQSTYSKGVLEGIGGFGAMFELGKYQNPVLVSSTDGVGTKILLAEKMDKYSGLGFDLVAMCVDDVVCCGAKPLFFLDYIALGKLKEDVYLSIIESIASACHFAGCALIGGETAELPGMYPDKEFDLAGFCVGAVEKKDILRSEDIKVGDAVIGLVSSAFHSNGYSLVRRVVDEKNLDLNKNYGFGELGKILLTPTEIYAPVLVDALSKFGKSIKGIAHITGGGIEGNLSRVLPKSCGALVQKTTWKIPEVIRFILREGNISEAEGYKVFNMGIGMALVVDARKKSDLLHFFNESSYKAYEIGEIVPGDGKVRLV